MTKPYNKGDWWFIKLDDGWEIRFISFEEAWEYYEAHQNDDND